MGKHHVIGLCFLVCAYFTAKSQTVSPTVPDFTNIHASWVTATYGNLDNPYAQIGVQPNRHAVITSPGTDKYTDGRLPVLPENTSAVVRLGEDRKGQSESISYRFVVDPEKTLLKVKMAIVANEDYYISVLDDRLSAWTRLQPSSSFWHILLKSILISAVTPIWQWGLSECLISSCLSTLTRLTGRVL